MLREVLTVEQFLRLPEIKPALEFVRGRVIQKVSPKRTHSVLQSELWARLRAYSKERDLGRPYIELRCTFAGDSVVPDIAYFSWGRIRGDLEGKAVDDVEVPPDLLIEIVSPGQSLKEMSSKLARYVRNGVGLAWLVRPSGKRVDVFRLGRPVEHLEMGEVLTGDALLPSFCLPLEELFGWLTQK